MPFTAAPSCAEGSEASRGAKRRSSADSRRLLQQISYRSSPIPLARLELPCWRDIIFHRGEDLLADIRIITQGGASGSCNQTERVMRRRF